MSTTKFVPKFKPAPSEEDNHINILLLSESGVGKSTFINSFANYLQFSKLIDAKDQKLTCLIPTKFAIHTEDGDTRVVTFLNDKNEDAEVGNSSTQRAKTYVFPFGNKMIRLIDTPLINDSRGVVVKDGENFEHFHAVCFLLKTEGSVLTASFKYCLIELFSRLDRPAAVNIAFLFTRTRRNNYTSTPTINLICQALDDIARDTGVTIPHPSFRRGKKTNYFYFDNEGFMYLVAMNQAICIEDAEWLKESFEVSYASSWRLIQYISGGELHACIASPEPGPSQVIYQTPQGVPASTQPAGTMKNSMSIEQSELQGKNQYYVEYLEVKKQRLLAESARRDREVAIRERELQLQEERSSTMKQILEAILKRN